MGEYDGVVERACADEDAARKSVGLVQSVHRHKVTHRNHQPHKIYNLGRKGLESPATQYLHLGRKGFSGHTQKSFLRHRYSR